MTIANQVIGIISKKLGVDWNDVTPEAYIIDNLGADGHQVVALIMALEEEFGMEIPDEDSENLLTVGELIDYVEKRVG
ncbi:MAG TPA: acyl carrier protein [Allosphingosinicella sp.]|nr:acyl carrier protein [Allosphingosinicella sp.]